MSDAVEWAYAGRKATTRIKGFEMSYLELGTVVSYGAQLYEAVYRFKENILPCHSTLWQTLRL
jgi:hypothetical protein